MSADYFDDEAALCLAFSIFNGDIASFYCRVSLPSGITNTRLEHGQ